MADESSRKRDEDLDALERELIEAARRTAQQGNARAAARLTNSLARLMRDRKTQD